MARTVSDLTRRIPCRFLHAAAAARSRCRGSANCWPPSWACPPPRSTVRSLIFRTDVAREAENLGITR